MATETQRGKPQGIEAFNLSLSEFDQAAQAYQADVAAFTAARREADRLRDAADRGYRGLESLRSKIEAAREGLLRERLVAEGLAICTEEGLYYERHNGADGTIWEKDALRRIGVYPTAEMNLVYSSSADEVRINRGYFDDFQIREIRVFGIYCPDHAEPDRANESSPSIHGEKFVPTVWTRVTELDGQFIRDVDGQVVTVPLRQGVIKPVLYTYFQIPDAPQLPTEAI